MQREHENTRACVPGVGLGLGLGEGEGAGLGVSGSGRGLGVSEARMAGAGRDRFFPRGGKAGGGMQRVETLDRSDCEHAADGRPR